MLFLQLFLQFRVLYLGLNASGKKSEEVPETGVLGGVCLKTGGGGGSEKEDVLEVWKTSFPFCKEEGRDRGKRRSPRFFGVQTLGVLHGIYDDLCL